MGEGSEPPTPTPRRRVGRFLLRLSALAVTGMLTLLREGMIDAAVEWFGQLGAHLFQLGCAYFHAHTLAVFRVSDLLEVTAAVSVILWLPTARASFCRLAIALYCTLIAVYYGVLAWAREDVVALSRGGPLRELAYLGMSLCLTWIVTHAVKRHSLFGLIGLLVVLLGAVAQWPGTDARTITLLVSLFGTLCAGVIGVIIGPRLSSVGAACWFTYVVALLIRPLVIWSADDALNLVYVGAMLLKFYAIVDFFSDEPPGDPPSPLLLAGRAAMRG